VVQDIIITTKNTAYRKEFVLPLTTSDISRELPNGIEGELAME